MGMYSNRTVDDNFLNSYFSYSDEEYLRRLRLFHSTVERLYGLTDGSTMAEHAKAVEMRKTFRQELQDETTKRLYRFLESIIAIGVPNVVQALSPSFEEWCLNDMDTLNQVFKNRHSWHWRDMNIWVHDDDKFDSWPDNPTVLEIELVAYRGDYEEDESILIPFKWLTENMVRNPTSDPFIAEAVALAEVKNDYASMFAHIHTKDGMKAVLDLIRDNGLVEKIEAINEMEHTKYGENKNA